jgi:hypothetical protein
MTLPEGSRPPTEPRPTMPPTRPQTLVWAFVVAAALSWALMSRVYGDLPRLSGFAPVPILLIALIEALIGRAARARIARRPGTVPLQPLVAARLVVLAKASSLGGALVGGAYAGILLYVFRQRTILAAASADLPIAAITMLSSLVLVAAALWLERCCRIPHEPDDDSDVTKVT